MIIKQGLPRLVLIVLALSAFLICSLRLLTVISFSSFEAEKPQVGFPKRNETFSAQKLNKILENPFSTATERSAIAALLAKQAEELKDPGQKLEVLCQTLLALQSALEKRPTDARTLVTWANVRQLLGSYKCQGVDALRFEDAIELALQVDPLDQQAIFNSALIYKWAGQNEKSFVLFKRVLDLGTDISRFQKEFIFSLVKDQQTLEALIPARIPQSLDYARYYLGNSNSNLESAKLWSFQFEALREFENRFQNGAIDSEIYLDRLFELWRLSQGSALTNMIDRLLAEYYSHQGPELLATYFSSRSRFSELETVNGYRLADSRPEKSSLYSWDSPHEIPLDEFFTSVGFFLPRDMTLRRIELQSNTRTEQQLSGLLRILHSDDNSSWEDLTGLCTIYQVALPHQWVVYIDVPASTKRFWKIHFASPSRLHQFKAYLPKLVRAFGIGRVREGAQNEG